MTSCSLVRRYQRFEEICFRHCSTSLSFTPWTRRQPPPPKLHKYVSKYIHIPAESSFIATSMRSPIPKQNPPNEKFKRHSQFVETHVPNNSKPDLKIILNTFNQTCSAEYLTRLGLSLRIYASCLFLCYWLFSQGTPSNFSDIHFSNKMVPLYKLPITNGISGQGYCCWVERGLQPLPASHKKTPRSKYRNIKECYLCAVIFLLAPSPTPTEWRMVVKCTIFEFSVPSGKPQVNSGLLP